MPESNSVSKVDVSAELMSVARQNRSSPERWKKILDVTYSGLRSLGAGDIWVFGSQAMSLHLQKRPLASKDLDLIATGVSTRMIEDVREMLRPYSSGRIPDYRFQSTTYEGRPYPFYSVSINDLVQGPFVIEIFETFRGYDVRRLTPYATFISRWENTYQTLTVEGIIGTRMAFRRPQGIDSFNAKRLNNFIKLVRKEVDWGKVNDFVRDFQLEEVILENLKDLHRRNIKIVDSEKLNLVKLSK